MVLTKGAIYTHCKTSGACDMGWWSKIRLLQWSHEQNCKHTKCYKSQSRNLSEKPALLGHGNRRSLKKTILLLTTEFNL